jgi:hypothetical protein
MFPEKRGTVSASQALMQRLFDRAEAAGRP